MQNEKRDVLYPNFKNLLDWIFNFFEVKSNDKYNNFSTFADYVKTSRSNITYWKNGLSFPEEQKQINLIKGINHYLDFRCKTETQFIEGLLQFCEKKLNIRRSELNPTGQVTLSNLLSKVFQKVYQFDIELQANTSANWQQSSRRPMDTLGAQEPSVSRHSIQGIKKSLAISLPTVLLIFGVIFAIFFVYERNSRYAGIVEISNQVSTPILWPLHERTGEIVVTNQNYELNGLSQETQMWGSKANFDIEAVFEVEIKTPDAKSVGVGLETWNTINGRECSVCFRNGQLQIIHDGRPVLTKIIDSYAHKRIRVHFRKSKKTFYAAIEKGLDKVITIKKDIRGTEAISVKPRIYAVGGKIKLYSGYLK